jgi:guanosine-3',5'-bis(diphosphate) 3'-pyrophosphohydrolase
MVAILNARMASPDVHQALLFAVRSHLGQDRDGASPLPYSCHPIEVMTLLRKRAGITDPVDLCAALLHDVLEETSVVIEDIEGLFGAEVGALVKELTREEPSPEETLGMTKDELYEVRTRLLLVGIESMSPRAKRIKLCDRLSNLMEAADTRTTAKLARYKTQTLSLLDLIPRHLAPDVWDELERIARS